VVDDQNIGGRDSFLSFLDNGLWGHLKGMDGYYFYDVFRENFSAS